MLDNFTGICLLEKRNKFHIGFKKQDIELKNLMFQDKLLSFGTMV